LAKESETKTAEQASPDLERIMRRLDLFDQRLDNIDSVVTAVAERVMKQPVTFSVTCSKCGCNIEIALVGTEKPGR
jgi:tRNA(Ser,Leu) C12 N-acetylase TAN1